MLNGKCGGIEQKYLRLFLDHPAVGRLEGNGRDDLSVGTPPLAVVPFVGFAVPQLTDRGSNTAFRRRIPHGERVASVSQRSGTRGFPDLLRASPPGIRRRPPTRRSTLRSFSRSEHTRWRCWQSGPRSRVQARQRICNQRRRVNLLTAVALTASSTTLGTSSRLSLRAWQLARRASTRGGSYAVIWIN